MNEVVRNLVREFERDGPLAPLVIEVRETEAGETRSGGVPVRGLPFPVVYDARHPAVSLLRFVVSAPVLFWRLRALCRRYSVEVLNPHFVDLQHLSLVLFKKLGWFRGRLLLSFHGADIREMIRSRGMKRYLSRLLLRGADALIPCSEGLGEEMLLLAPECAGKIVPIQNGIDIARFLVDATQRYPIPAPFAERRKLLNIGAFEYKKGHDILLKAFAQVRARHPDVCLIIAGQKKQEIEATRQLIGELKIEEDVLLLTDLPHACIGTLLQAAEIFVLSSRWDKGVWGEGFAMVLLEAAAVKKPVVSTLSCGVAELITEGESGSIVPVDNPRLLARAVEDMLNNPEDAARQGRNLHERVARDFTWEQAHQRYLRAAGA